MRINKIFCDKCGTEIRTGEAAAVITIREYGANIGSQANGSDNVYDVCQKCGFSIGNLLSTGRLQALEKE